MQTASIIERNIANAKRLIDEVINTGKPELCDRYLAADRIDYQDYGLPPGMANGHEGFKRVLGGFFEAFPDLHLEVQFTVAGDDRIMFYISTTGTHRGPFMGVAPTGKQFKVNGVDIFRFNDEGKVAAHWGVFDTFGMLAQLGLVPPPGQS
jgi:predicted ester cyclase